MFKWTLRDVDENENDDAATTRIESDRPDFTETSTPVGLGRIQLESGYTYTTNRASGIRLHQSTFPEALLRVGLFAEWFELRIGWNYNNDRSTSPEPFSTRVTGSSDLYLGFKLALTEQASFLPEMAINVQTTAPTGAKAFTADRWLPGINWLYGWNVTDVWTFGGSTSFNAAKDNDKKVYTEIGQSFTAGYSITEKLSCYFEVYGIMPSGGEAPDLKPQYSFDSGFVYRWSNDFQTDIRAGIGLNQAADDFFTGVGFVYRY